MPAPPRSGPSSFGAGSLASWALAATLLLPALVWNQLHLGPLGGDDSQYARGAVELHHAALHTPAEWPRRMLEVLPFRPSGLIWLGQVFVGLAPQLGSVERALMLAVWLAQVATVATLYRTVVRLAPGERGAALAGALVIAAAPLHILLGGYFLVEPLQTLAVAGFLWLLARAPDRPPALTLAQLVVASAFAVLTKTTTPLFCVGPGVAAAWLALGAARRRHWGWRQPAVQVSLALGLVLGGAAAAFYARNWEPLTSHLRAASRGHIGVLWGKEDTLWNTLGYWLGVVARGFFLPVVAGLLALALATALAASRPPDPGRHRLDLGALVAAGQVVVVLLVFSASPMRQPRFLLPLLPHVALLAAWAVARLRRPAVTAAVAGALALQLVAVQARAFDRNGLGSELSRPIDRDGSAARILAEIVARTCPAAGETMTIVAIEGFRGGDWLAPEPVRFIASKRLLEDPRAAPCRYDYLGGSFFGKSLEAAWEDLRSGKARYVVTTDPLLHAAPQEAFNHGLDRVHQGRLWQLLDDADVFVRQAPLAADAGIAVFRRRDAARSEP